MWANVFQHKPEYCNSAQTSGKVQVVFLGLTDVLKKKQKNRKGHINTVCANKLYGQRILRYGDNRHINSANAVKQYLTCCASLKATKSVNLRKTRSTQEARRGAKVTNRAAGAMLAR